MLQGLFSLFKNKKLTYFLISFPLIISLITFFFCNYSQTKNQQNNQKELSFETFVKSDGTTNNYNQSPEKIILMMITKEDDFNQLWQKMHPSEARTLPPWPQASLSLNFAKDVLMVVMSDKKSSLCCLVEIKKIYLQDNQNLLVEIEETLAGKDCPVGEVITRPYHIVRINKGNYQKLEYKKSLIQKPPCNQRFNFLTIGNVIN